jgi:hypothetical protein
MIILAFFVAAFFGGTGYLSITEICLIIIAGGIADVSFDLASIRNILKEYLEK